YNGLKLFSAEGRVIPADAGQRVIERFQVQSRGAATNPKRGAVEPCPDSVDPHWSLLCQIVDVDRIKRRQFTVLLDSNHGAGSLVARRLFEELGCRATMIGDEPDGLFAHTPEPTAEN